MDKARAYKEPHDIKVINSKLKSKFGFCEGHIKFRIVWSDAELEHRKIDFVNGIHLLFPEIRIVPKYPYSKERFILERWTPFEHDTDIATAENGSYEPVWVWQTAKGEAIRPIYNAVYLVCNVAEHGNPGGRRAGDAKSEDEAALVREIESFEQMLEEEQTHNYGNQSDAFVAPVFKDSTKRFQS